MAQASGLVLHLDSQYRISIEISFDISILQLLLFAICASLSTAVTKELLPLTPEELRPVFIDLGIGFDN